MAEGNNNTQVRNAFDGDLRDLWDQYILIQEQLLRKKCAPISILPNSTHIDGNKFSVIVDESGREKIIEKVFKDRLKIANEDILDDSIFVDEEVWSSLSEYDISSIQKELASCYITMDRTPSVNAKIFYGNGITFPNNQMTLAEIKNFDKALQSNHICRGKIDDIVACITTINVDTELFYLYIFGEKHYSRRSKVRSGQTITRDHIEYTNHYISDEDMKKYNNMIGLRPDGYGLIFTITNPAAKDIMRSMCNYYENGTGSFVFNRTYSKEERPTCNMLHDAQMNISTFVKEARKYCSAEEISVTTKFRYIVSIKKTVLHIFDMVAQYTYQNSNMSFNAETGSLGIDFNWRTDNINEIIYDLERKIPFISAKFYGENHRFKCNVTTSFVGLKEIEKRLYDRFDSIKVEDNAEKHYIQISIPSPSIKYYDKLLTSLKSEIYAVAPTHNVEVDHRVSGKVKILIKDNNDSRIEDLEENLRELRKADFGFDTGEKVIPFGKLLSINYPKLTFDINVESSKEEALREYIDSQSASFVVPILTGDIEKISRLKNTFTMATTGTNLLNENLQNFIFDSALATPTKDLQYILRHDGGPYNELNKHLLNKRINESQKHAILKCIFAEDMAVIQGPPGTGKSTAIAELIWQLIRHGMKSGNKKERILLTSETNLAVDNAISRIVNHKTNLVKPVRFGDEGKLEAEGLQFSIDLMKKWVEDGNSALSTEDEDEDTGESIKSNLILNNWLSNISSRSFYGLEDEGNEVMCRWKKILYSPSKEIREITYRRYIESCNVIGATCSSIGDKRSDGRGSTQFFRYFKEVFDPKGRNTKIEFSTVIQDESSKATPAELVLPFVYGQKAIVIGDHRQLPPMLDREEIESSLEYAFAIAKSEKERAKIERLQNFLATQFEKIEESHFQHLYENIDPSLKETFNLQYRMHPDINDVIKQFYAKDGGLNCGLIHPKDLGVNDSDFSNAASRYHGIDMRPFIGHNTHVLFINTDSPEMLDGTSRVNYGEIDVIDKLLTKFEQSSTYARYLDKFDKDEDKQIGIISFYGKQIKQIRSIANQHKRLSIRVSTVDRFQGMERNIIIVSMVRSHIIQSHINETPNYARYKEYGYPAQHSLGFAQSPNRLNVALSRAKRLLIIVGNEKLFSQHPIYEQLFKTIRNNPNNNIIDQKEL